MITLKTLFMPAIKKPSGKKKAYLISGKHPRTPIDKNMPDYDQDPVFVKKHEDARAFLRKNGLPKEVLQKISEKKK